MNKYLLGQGWHDIHPEGHVDKDTAAGLILGLHPANKRCRYKVTASLIGWAQT